MLDICTQLFETWEKKGIDYCHWKGNEHLAKGLDGLGDMDVLVNSVNRTLVENELRKLNFLKVINPKIRRNKYVDDWIGFDELSGKMVHLHLYYKLITGKEAVKDYSLPWEDLFLSTKVREDNSRIFIPDPNLEIITLFTRLILKASPKQIFSARLGKYTIPRKIVDEIDYLKRFTNKNKLHNIANIVFIRFAREICDIIDLPVFTSNDYLKLNRMVKYELRMNRNYGFVFGWALSLYNRLISKAIVTCIARFNSLFISRKTIPCRGAAIAFLGTDGSGKSTIANDIKKWLTWKLDCRLLYLGSGDNLHTPYSYVMKRINRMGRSFNKSKGNQNETKSKTPKIEKTTITRKIFDKLNMHYLLYIAKRYYKEINRGTRYVNLGGIALFDRFPQIQFKGINDGPKIEETYKYRYNECTYAGLAKKEEEYIKKAFGIQPDLVFKLIVSPEVSLKRKPDHKIADITRKAEIIKSLEFNNSLIYEVNADQDYASELLEIKRAIWTYLINQVKGDLKYAAL